MLLKILYIGAGGFLGAVSRFGISRLINNTFPLAMIPWGTVVVNGSGSFLLAYLMAAGMQRSILPPQLILFLGTGFLGAFTTFSTFTYEAISLYQQSVLRGVIYCLIMLISGFLLAVTGYLLGRS